MNGEKVEDICTKLWLKFKFAWMEKKQDYFGGLYEIHHKVLQILIDFYTLKGIFLQLSIYELGDQTLVIFNLIYIYISWTLNKAFLNFFCFSLWN